MRPLTGFMLLTGLLTWGCMKGQNAPQVSRLPATSVEVIPAQSDAIASRSQGEPAPTPDQQQQREQQLIDAQAEYDRDPHDEQAIIWLGRRLAYLGRYDQAIDVFTNGLAIHPESYRLLRHRGHRYITVREFGFALADLQRAAELITNVPDETEPDGQPNAQGIPTSTSHTNIYYHLGLAHYLSGDFASAARAYQQCMKFATNDDMRVATAYWQYLTMRQLGDEAAAARVLQPVHAAMTIIENTSYHRLLLMFRGDLSPDHIVPANENGNSDPSVDHATIGYGLGMWHLFRGDLTAADRQFRSVIDSTNGAAFGHIASEVELTRLGTRQRAVDQRDS